MKNVSVMAIVLASVSSAAIAAPLVYRPMNPHISPGAYPSNVSAMNDIATLNKPKNTRPDGKSTNDPADLASRSIYYGIASDITQKVLAACPSGTPNCSGTHVFDGVIYAFTTTGDQRRITITYPNGGTTVIDTTVSN